MYVLDTDVLSLTNAATGFGAREVEAWRTWVVANPHGLFLSVVTLMEVRFGIEKCLARGASKKADGLRKWLVAAETLHRNRIIPISIDIAHKAGELLHRAVASGAQPSSEDAFIAATADVAGFTLLSRNAKDMRALGVNWMNPLEALPPDIPTV